MSFRAPYPFGPKTPRVAVLRLQGVIAAGGGRGALSHATLSPLIERAFRKGKPKAVALQINSPGGSPVQSALIGAHIRRLGDELKIPIHAFVEDVAASGGYWLAAAADDIHVDPSSITGSIGVISAGFGFHELIGRWGIERRVHTAGEDKSLLDPFRPERDSDIARLKTIQARIHDSFIAHVKARRGDKLAEDRDLFTGDIFVGEEAVEAGLVDGIGHLVPVLRERYGEHVTFSRLAPRRPFLQRLIPSVLDETASALEARALWARYGI
ncbi:S49 family peptidase [Jannaschia seohaensis]|uniref:Signal peptide peptidase SppA n=1 Tax=Jannaschia seohaensis TaxID=475081 RepID=A0A2Y9A8T0_9RHOB|nr:S49 family peptidase [Jannaschia seohaensis]PWJ22329.1 signal peptide peptidase SppA [Jannaschia seohaensis]SSA38607.1 signal peptide peptidase SppA [Jannaschia seohaensis]